MTAFIQLSAARTAYRESGAGAPIVLIHGGEADMRGFEPLAAALGEAGTVVRYDQRGCGETTGDAAPHGLLELADDAAELMAALGHARYAVFGTSLGGRIAQALALRHPEPVGRLILCNTWPLDARLEDVAPENAARLQALRGGLPETAAELAGMFFTPEYVAARPELLARYARIAPAGRRASLARETHRPDAMPIRQPTLLISADRDAVVPPAVVAALAARLPAARLATLPGVGHAAASLAPREVATLIADFLRSS